MEPARRSFEVVVGAACLGAVLWSASTACWPVSGGSTGPIQPGCQPEAVTLNCIGVTLNVIADGPVTFTFDGKAYSSSRDTTLQLIGLLNRQYEIAGRMSTANVTFYIIGRKSTIFGGVETTSLQSVLGPFIATPSPCHITYAAAGASPPPQDFKFQFTVGTTPPTC